MQLNQDYKPVNCNLSDDLESLSVRHKPVRLKLILDDGHSTWRQGQIKDLFTKDHADFIELSDGSVFRLDKIVEWRNV
jgi:transcriptional antiterminator Rof (Rho-off)